MHTYFLSFRLKTLTTDSRETYDDRYKNLEALIDGIATKEPDDQTTSCYIFKSNLTLDQILEKVKQIVNLNTDFIALGVLDSINTRYIKPDSDGTKGRLKSNIWRK